MANPVDNTMRVSENIEEICEKAKCKLSARQVMCLRGALMVWIPKLQDEANRELANRLHDSFLRSGMPGENAG